LKKTWKPGNHEKPTKNHPDPKPYKNQGKPKAPKKQKRL
jgi:hypothetical protein